ncbi:MAG: hypothetical protein JXX14_12245 [Deltaproteobacteria bacterium]|nr:hypothetical protein [Deltaproteobacteria bacterium]
MKQLTGLASWVGAGILCGKIAAVLGVMVGCSDAADSVLCVVHADCGQGRCVNGLCVDRGDVEVDSLGASDTETDFQAPELVANLDVLFVVDNSASMIQEQELLATSMYSFFNALHVGVKDGFWIDARMAVITSDMGLHYDGGVYEDSNFMFDNPQVKCSGSGDNGEMVAEYLPEYLNDDIQVTVPVTPAKITCRETADDDDCPVQWTCTNMNMQGVGTCTPRYEHTSVSCPELSTFTQGNRFVSPLTEKNGDTVMDYPGFIAAGACLMHTGVDGCNYEQQLAAIPAALMNPNQQVFLRSDALTLIIVITDEEDCSHGSEDWFHLNEISSVSANLACGKYPELAQQVESIRQEILDAKKEATGVDGASSVLFAAITGVPVGSACEGRGDRIGNCADVKPGVNGEGTMENPDVVGRTVATGVEQLYYEYACQRFEETTGGELVAVTSAYPAMRIVQMAQLFGDKGYIYSICNEDWTPIMTQLGEAVQQRLKIEY